MPVLTWINNHRLWTLGTLCILLVGAAAAFWFFVLRSPGTPVGVQQAIRYYRQTQRSNSTGPKTTLPPSGVYRFGTSGGESLSIGGITRSFPAATDLIVTDGRCATMAHSCFSTYFSPHIHSSTVITGGRGRGRGVRLLRGAAPAPLNVPFPRENHSLLAIYMRANFAY